jgi:hypothetical protein
MVDGPPRRRLSPPLVTVVSLAAILIAMRILQFRADDGSDASRRFVTGAPWFAWTAVAGLSLAIFVVSFVIGLTTIARPSEELGLRSVPPRRRYGYLAVACALVLVLAVAMFAGTVAPPAVMSCRSVTSCCVPAAWFSSASPRQFRGWRWSGSRTRSATSCGRRSRRCRPKRL